MAEQGPLTGATYTRPAGYANMSFPAYAPSTDFPVIPLSHPAGSSTTTVPRVVFEAIMAQESNFSQASWHSPAGNSGNPLIADYYGAGGDIVSINYAGADCGYGISQVTTGMHIGDHTFSARGQVKVAVDYQENIAAGLQILQDKWNQLYTAGIIANNGDPKYLENWYFAAWAYNGGVQPSSAYNSTGCTPGPTCTGPHGTWGLGWTNNPDNLDYPPNRLPYLQASYADAAHPASWPYQERVMGWMASPIQRYGAKAYAKPPYNGGKTWLQIPAFNSFCSLAGNNCDPVNTNTSNPGATHCMFDDFQCWWHTPVTWIPDCATTCATSPYLVGAGSTEPAFPTPNVPTCTIDQSKMPAGSIIVDDETSPPLNIQGCNSPNWTTGPGPTAAPVERSPKSLAPHRVRQLFRPRWVWNGAAQLRRDLCLEQFQTVPVLGGRQPGRISVQVQDRISEPIVVTVHLVQNLLGTADQRGTADHVVVEIGEHRVHAGCGKESPLGLVDRLVRPLGLLRRPCREVPRGTGPDHRLGRIATVGPPAVAIVVDQLLVGSTGLVTLAENTGSPCCAASSTDAFDVALPCQMRGAGCCSGRGQTAASTSGTCRMPCADGLQVTFPSCQSRRSRR